MVGPDQRPEFPGQSGDRSSENDLEVIVLPRGEAQDRERLLSEVDLVDDEERDFFGHAATHISSVSRILEVKGIFLEEDQELGDLRLAYIVNDRSEIAQVMGDVGRIHADLAQALPPSLGGRLTYTFGFCNGDFDGLVEKVKNRPRPEDRKPTGNVLADLVSSTVAGFRAVEALKFED